MTSLIRLPLSVDHQKKKARSIELPFALYLHFITSDEFEAILPKELKAKAEKSKKTFLAQNQFFSEEYQAEYERSGYIRFLTGPDVHKFFAKILSLNYQAHQNLLQEQAGSFQEYFSDLKLFWNGKYHREIKGADFSHLRQALFCQACLRTQHKRMTEKQTLYDKLGDFAKQEIKAKELEVKRLKQELRQTQQETQHLQEKCEGVEQELAKVKEDNIVLVPSDPHYMLGLDPKSAQDVEARAKILLKTLHPDRSGSHETGYLFDMVVKARDMILK
ncbi:hypothetical protein [Terasakiella sp. SH-1]|uniref:hypothetical protein n=1 Tax=Terasakiella sp. SH-1 TaxID=2560057 RepID=UPI0010741F0E|nr:hypothetical protein [Terasakiella sp. SH-1]